MCQIKQFSVRGHDVLLEFDPATADMEKVNNFIKSLEPIGRVFSDATSEVVTTATIETGDMTFVRQQAGG